MALAPGDRFTVTAEKEIRTDRGRLIARFLPGHDYRVTPRNLKDVEAMVALGEARTGSRPLPAAAPNAVAAKPARVTGRARTGKRRS